MDGSGIQPGSSNPSKQWATDLSPCIAQLDDGSTCGERSAEYAPFPICNYHAVRVYRFVKNSIGGLSDDPLYRAHYHFGEIEKERDRDARQAENRRPVVYYVQVGEHIKIGYTGRLKRRMTQYPLNRRLLAVESGDYSLEQERHQQFREYLALGNEWFTPGPKLMAHINLLRLGSGAQPVKLPLDPGSWALSYSPVTVEPRRFRQD